MTDARRTGPWCIVGPTHPFRGGIPRHTTLLTDAAAETGIDTQLVTFTRQYPGWLYKGASDRDPDQLSPKVARTERILDSLNPVTWRRGARLIGHTSPRAMVVVWWHPFFAPMVATLLRQVRRRSPSTIQLALCHNVLPHESSPVDRRLTRTALAPVDGLVVHAESQARIARDLVGDRPTLVTPHPTYTFSPEVLAARRPRDDTVRLLFFGLVRHYKGVDVLLRALPRVLRERPVHLVIAGEFWDRPEDHRALARTLGVERHVEFRAGYVPDDELPRLFGTTDLVVAPYRSATQSGAVEMAFGAGLPVVASRVGGLAHQVRDGTNGLLVPPDDPEALSRALLDATAAPMLDRLTAGARAPETVHTWTDLVGDIDGMVTELDARGRAAPSTVPGPVQGSTGARGPEIRRGAGA
ncbi:MAG: glycosyltransferase [Acidimicrobiia bacterium]